MSERKAQILMASVIIARSTAYLFSKTLLQTMDRFTVLANRFLLAFLLLCILFFRRMIRTAPRTLLRGMILGTVFFIVMSFELGALKTAETSTTSFLENTAIIYVPLLAALVSFRLPDRDAALRAVIAVTGIGIMTLNGAGFRFSPGELQALAAALFYAIVILLTGKFSHEDDPLQLGVIQIGTLGILSLGAAFLYETPRLPGSGTEWFCLAALVFVCTGFGFTLQPVAQKYLRPEQASIFCALVILFGTLSQMAVTVTPGSLHMRPTTPQPRLPMPTTPRRMRGSFGATHPCIGAPDVKSNNPPRVAQPPASAAAPPRKPLLVTVMT